MMGSSIKNSNVEVTISQNLVEALRNDLSVAQTSPKGLIKNTGITGRGDGLLCPGLSLDEAQALFNAGILSGHQFNMGNLSNYHLKAGNLSESHVHKLSDSHAFLATSSSDDDLSLSDSQALSPFELSGVLSFKCDGLSLLSSDQLSGLSKCDDLSLVSSDILSGFSKGDNLSPLHQDLTVDRGVMSDDPVTLPFVLSGSTSSSVSGDLSEVSLASNDLLDASVESGDLSGLSGNLSDSYHASGLEPCIFSPSQVVRDLVEDSDLSALMSDDLEDTNKNTTILQCSTSTLLSSRAR
jgi:hypothetical protein